MLTPAAPPKSRWKGATLRERIDDGAKAAVELEKLQRAIFEALRSASKFVERLSADITPDLIQDVEACRDGRESWKSMGEVAGSYADLADELNQGGVLTRVRDGMRAAADLYGFDG